jgi:hypothetical protein
MYDKFAFLNGSLSEEVFVIQPPRFVVTGRENVTPTLCE